MSERLGKETNALNWFEISVNDIDRAVQFYQSIFECEFNKVEMMGMKMAFFPTDDMSGKVGGSLTQSDMHKPATTGSILYLNGNPDLQHVLDRVEPNGGKVTMPKTFISEDTGYMAFFMDIEGNNIGLHSNG